MEREGEEKNHDFLLLKIIKKIRFIHREKLEFFPVPLIRTGERISTDWHILYEYWFAHIMTRSRWLSLLTLALISTAFTAKGQSESLLRVGKAINVFVRYGYLSISMKVISYNDTEKWIFKVSIATTLYM
jgi:hypothetical protein